MFLLLIFKTVTLGVYHLSFLFLRVVFHCMTFLAPLVCVLQFDANNVAAPIIYSVAHDVC